MTGSSDRQDPEVGRPAALLPALGVAGAHEDPVRPGLEAGRFAELREVLPDGEQRLLRRVLGEVDVAQDPARHGEEPVGDLRGDEGVGPLVAVLGPDHEVDFHASSACRHRSVRCRSQGMGEWSAGDGECSIGSARMTRRGAHVPTRAGHQLRAEQQDPRVGQAAHRFRRFRSARISRAAFRPGAPVTPPPGCAPDPARYSPSTGIR